MAVNKINRITIMVSPTKLTTHLDRTLTPGSNDIYKIINTAEDPQNRGVAQRPNYTDTTSGDS
jgi:hypothetical protein